MKIVTLKNWLETQRTGFKFYYSIDCGNFIVGGSSDDDADIDEEVIYKSNTGEYLGIVKYKTIYNKEV